MADHTDLDWVLSRFPAAATQARRLYATEPSFRAACEDYRLAREGLARFEKLAEASPRPELAEYWSLVRELETELLRLCRSADAGPPWS